METRFDGSSELVAELVTANGFKAAYAIKDGAEGPKGWMVVTLFLSLLVLSSPSYSFSVFSLLPSSNSN